jgi:molybdenum cofactor guanylyltransferase
MYRGGTGCHRQVAGYGDDVSDDVLVTVLAGGRASRMGAAKADVVVAGRTMREHVLAAAAAAGLDAVQAGGAAGIPDRRPPHSGPLAGIETGLVAADGRDVIAVAVDQPWLLPRTLGALAGRDDAIVVPLDGGRFQVTCARYGAGCLPVIVRLLDAGLGTVKGLLTEFEPAVVLPQDWGTWGEDGRSWFSADTPDAIAAGLRTFGPPGTLPS